MCGLRVSLICRWQKCFQHLYWEHRELTAERGFQNSECCLRLPALKAHLRSLPVVQLFGRRSPHPRI